MRAAVASSPFTNEATFAARLVSAKALSSSEGSIRNSPSSVLEAADSLPAFTARQMVDLDTPTALAASLRLRSVSGEVLGIAVERALGVAERFRGRFEAFGECGPLSLCSGGSGSPTGPAGGGDLRPSEAVLGWVGGRLALVGVLAIRGPLYRLSGPFQITSYNRSTRNGLQRCAIFLPKNIWGETHPFSPKK